MKRVLIALAAVASIHAAHAVVEPGHWWVATSSQQPGRVQLGIDQTPEGDWTASLLSLSGRTLRAETHKLDGGADFFVVSKYQLLTQEVLATDAVTLLAGPSALQAQGPGVTLGEAFWLGAASGTRPAAPYHPYIVGIVPQPATWALMGLGLAATGLALRRRRSC